MNRLAGAPSPYLRQHAANPVDWQPWDDAALAQARDEQRPIFLSIGYATCHWCHVMAHESFEDPSTAAILNREFVCIKVDREERPDVDRVYMTFVQATTGAGGWPLSVWLTPSLEPFYGGTYFPPQPARGRPSFTQVAQEIARAWREDRAGIARSAVDVLARLRAGAAPPPMSGATGAEVLDAARAAWAQAFDDRRGGFGDGPKFPRPSELAFLLREHARTGDPHARLMALATLRAMSLGGMRDHVGGGFHRYSVDGGWRVPHFEKMLYDQAQIVMALLEASQVGGDPFFAQVAEDTLRYVARDLTAPEGGFYSAEDADSIPPALTGAPGAHAAEGAFYTWTHDEIVEALGPDARLWALRFGVRPGGNAPFDPQGEFGAANLLYTAKTIAAIAEETGVSAADVGQALARGRQRLFARRVVRPRPLRDEKILTAWNGLMIAALARASRVLARPGALGDESGPTGATHLGAAQRAAAFARTTLWDPSRGRVLRRFAAGSAGIDGFAEDYACLAYGLVELFQADGDPAWLTWARTLVEVLERRFAAPGDRGWFATTGEDPTVLLRQVEDYDGAEPSASAVAVHTLLVLARLTGDTSYRVRAERVLEAWSGSLRAQPRGAPFMLAALSTASLAPLECVITGDASGRARMAHVADGRFLPAAIVISAAAREGLVEAVPWIAPLLAASNGATAYVCRDFACEAPVHDANALAEVLARVAPTSDR